MKKQLALTVVIAAALLGACGQEDNKTTGKSTTSESISTEQSTTDSETTTNAVEDHLHEPTKDTVCEFCNMKVYEMDHEMGAFSAQGIKEDGTGIFFDDVGCMLNQERKDGLELEKFVRDNNSKDWLKLEDAVIVKADIKTPMNYGYAYFKDQESADIFIAGNDSSKVVTLSDVDKVSNDRYKKMKDRHSSESKNMEMDMDSESGDSESMDMDMKSEDSH